MGLFEWLRRNSEHYLIEAAQADMARRYLGRMPDHSGEGLVPAFWRRVYVPVYRRIPWAVRRRLIVAMPGSHRRTWRGLRERGAVISPSDDRAPPVGSQQHEQGS
jgi:hypothetical protein